jgi:GPH family glycoside/pentoside/hexuronide:cation symporter
MSEKSSLRSKLAYGVSDFASNLAWGTVGSYLMIYYTDVAKISAMAVGTMLLVTRIWDAINDPIMGTIIDKTHTRWGKCRPYFLWMCVPLAVVMVLTYSVPEISAGGKVVYAYVTFILLGMIYTAINIPVTAILPRLTADMHERTIFGTFRMFGAIIGGLLVNTVTLPLIKALGGDNQGLGFRLTISAYAVLVIILFLITFLNVKEVIVDLPHAKTEKSSATGGFKAVKGNLPWLIMLIVGMILQMMSGVRGAASVYYCRYNMQNDGLVPLLASMMILMLVPMAFIPVIAKKLGKRNTVLMGCIVALVGYFLVLISGQSVPLLILGNAVGSIGLAFAIGLLFTMIADTVDYGEWKNGVRSEGFLSAAASFGQKLGVGIGGAAAAWILGFGGYDGGAAVQSESALTAIKFNYAILPIILIGIATFLLLFYTLDKETPQMLADLKARRSAQ